MQWFRKHIRHGARLALLALAVQLALSFGHVHAAPHRTAVDAKTPVAASPSFAEPITAAIDAEYVGFSLADRGDGKPGHAPAHTPSDDCAICAVLALAGAVLFAQPPVLLLPAAIDFLYHTTDAGLIHLDPASTAFQPRAPPIS